MANQPINSSKDGIVGPHDTVNKLDLDSIVRKIPSMLNFNDDQSSTQANDLTYIEAINFYCDLFNKKESIMELTVDSMHSRNLLINRAIGVKNPKELKDFLSKYPQLFNIKADKISLKNPTMVQERRVDWIKKILERDHSTISKSVVNAIQFYSDVLYHLKSTLSCVFISIGQLITHRNKAKEDVQIIATNPVELKSFLMVYPQIFIITEDKVSLTDRAVVHKRDNTWLKELIHDDSRKSSKISSLRKAVEYFLAILLKEEKVPILELYKYSSEAPKDIQVFIKTFEEFIVFLSNHSEIFSIKNGAVIINDGLSQQIKKVECESLEDTSKISALKTKPIDEDVKIIKELMERATLVEIPINQLMDMSESKSKKSLKALLLKNPNIFVIRGDKVILRHYYDLIMIHDSTAQKTEDQAVRSNAYVCSISDMRDADLFSLEVINYVKNVLLEQAGTNVHFPLEQLLNLRNSAPPIVKQLFSTKDNIRLVISQYSNLFSVTEDTILLKDSFDKVIILKPTSFEALLFLVHILKEKVGIGIQFPITRLKIDVAPLQAIINDYLQLRKFLRKFPDIFSVTYHNVALKKCKFVNSLDSNDYSKIYDSYDEFFYDKSYAVKEGIEFYSRIIKRFCFNLEITISHLWGYRCLAPIEVLGLAKDSTELKTFLLSHPDVFIIREDKVSLYQLNNCKEFHSGPIDEKVKMAIEFYKSIISRVSHNQDCPIVILFGYQHSASPEVKELIKTPLDLKNFLDKFPCIFSVVSGVVMLRSGASCFDKENSDKPLEVPQVASSDQNTMLQQTPQCVDKPSFVCNMESDICAQFDVGSISEPKSKMDFVIRAIRFYANIMFKKGPNSVHAINDLWQSEGPSEIKAIVNNPTELLSLLSMFPELFSVDSIKLTVKMANMVLFYKNQRAWIKELLPKYHHSTTNHESVVSGIQFYANILCEKSPRFSLFTKTLFSHRKTAMEDVQLLAKSPLELIQFLSLFPEIFVFNYDIVSLTTAASSQILQPQWIEQIVQDHDLTPLKFSFDAKSTEDCKINLSNITDETSKIDEMKVVDYFKSVLEKFGTGALVPLEEIIKYRFSGPQCVGELITNPSNLKNLFVKYPNIFIVKKQCVTLKRLKKENNIFAETQRLSACDSTDPQPPQNFDGDKVKSASNCQENYLNTVACAQDMNAKHKKVISSLLFYINIMCRKGTNLEYSIKKLYSHQAQASNDIKETIKNEKEFKLFLAKFPELFIINHEKSTVTMASSFDLQRHQESWIEEILPNSQSSIDREIISAIQFFSNIILEKSIESEMLLEHLYSHKNMATNEVKKVATNPKALYSILSKFPDIFLVNNNTVSLTDLAIYHKTHPQWLEKLVCNTEISLGVNEKPAPPPEIRKEEKKKKSSKKNLLKNKSAVICKGIQFYHNIMVDNSPNNGFSLTELFDCLKEAPSEVKGIAQNSAELKLFFSKYPHIFNINDNVVSLDKKVSPK